MLQVYQLLPRCHGGAEIQTQIAPLKDIMEQNIVRQNRQRQHIGAAIFTNVAP